MNGSRSNTYCPISIENYSRAGDEIQLTTVICTRPVGPNSEIMCNGTVRKFLNEVGNEVLVNVRETFLNLIGIQSGGVSADGMI